ncbi:MCE family protein [bacterium]|nr:MCE family protein [bacterium]NIN93218.1 MCE family protein [bacterium]NIO19015.1 MCE family protein [bacterium]NIO74144.1 MCE family protein [bacterium]
MLSQETKVGLFVLCGLVALVIVTFLLGDIHLEKRYKIKILFNDVSGLPEKAQVRRAGVVVGKVIDIELVDNKAQVVATIKKDVRIHRDARARIVSFGLVGTKYLEITAGSKKEPLLEEGDTIIGIDPVGIDTAVEEILLGVGDLVEEIRGIGGEEELGKSLRVFLDNIGDVTRKMNKALGPEGQELEETIKNLNQLSANIREITDGLNQESITSSLQKLDRSLDEIAEVAEKINRGEGVMGRLLTDEKMGEQIEQVVESLQESSEQAKKVLRRTSDFKTTWRYQLNYNVNDEKLRSDFGLFLIPGKERFYHFSVNNIGDSDSDNDSGEQRANSVTVNAGKNWGLFSLYGGVIRSSGGFGGAFWPVEDRIGIDAEVFHLSRKKPWLNTGARFRINDWCYLGINGEDILNQGTVNSSIGIVLR